MCPLSRTKKILSLALLPKAAKNLMALQQRERFDVIQADLPVSGILARLIGKWCDVPVVYTEHNLQERYRFITRWANAATYGWNRRVLAVSAEVTASMDRFGLIAKTRVVTVPNGIPIEAVRAEAALQGGVRHELNIPDGHLIVGTVAVFRSQKRLDDWLSVAARIAAHRSDVTFVIVGTGPLEADLRARVDQLDLSSRVRMPGFRRDGRRLMGAIDVYLMTSEFEGLPIALLEAMAIGKPVVSTDVGGIPEVLHHGVSGLLARTGAISDLADHVLRLLDSPSLRAEMGTRGAATIESSYHARGRIRTIENLYHEVLREVA